MYRAATILPPRYEAPVVVVVAPMYVTNTRKVMSDLVATVRPGRMI